MQTPRRPVLLLLSAIWLLACSDPNPLAPPADPEQAARLTTDILSREWVLTWFATADGTLEPALGGIAVTLSFQPDGTLGGHGGCNGYGGSWTQAADGTLSMGGIFSTLIACEASGAQEQRFFRALERGRAATRIDETLRIDFGQAGEYLMFELLIGEQIPSAAEVGEIKAIGGGISFGECFGYCWEEIQLTRDQSVLTKGGWAPDSFPEMSVAKSQDAIRWQHLTGLPDAISLFELDEVIGCPDCADGGAEWLEIETLSSRHRITYEYGKPPKALADLAGALQSLRDSMRGGFVIATVIIE